MKRFIEIVRNALKPCAGLVHVPRRKLLLPKHADAGRRYAPASGALVSRGSIAMSRCPLVTVSEISERKEIIKHYDFNSLK